MKPTISLSIVRSLLFLLAFSTLSIIPLLAGCEAEEYQEIVFVESDNGTYSFIVEKEYDDGGPHYDAATTHLADTEILDDHKQTMVPEDLQPGDVFNAHLTWLEDLSYPPKITIDRMEKIEGTNREALDYYNRFILADPDANIETTWVYVGNGKFAETTENRYSTVDQLIEPGTVDEILFDKNGNALSVSNLDEGDVLTVWVGSGKSAFKPQKMIFKEHGGAEALDSVRNLIEQGI